MIFATMCICNQPLPIHKHMQMAPADVCIWPPPLPALVPSCWTWNHHLELLKNLQLPCTRCSTHEESLSYRFCGPQWPDPMRHHAYLDHSCHTLPHCQTASIPTPRGTVLSSVLPPTVEGLYLAKSVYKLWKRRLLLQMYRHLQKATGIMENQGSMISPKEQSKLPVADLKK